MTTIHVQFADAGDQVIVSTFSCPQDPEVWPNQGSVEADDPRWHSYYEVQPEFARELLITPE